MNPQYLTVHESGATPDYYVNGLLDIAQKAIPAIDEVELENRTSVR